MKSDAEFRDEVAVEVMRLSFAAAFADKNITENELVQLVDDLPVYAYAVADAMTEQRRSRNEK